MVFESAEASPRACGSRCDHRCCYFTEAEMKSDLLVLQDKCTVFPLLGDSEDTDQVQASCGSDTSTTCDRLLSLSDFDADQISCCDGHIHHAEHSLQKEFSENESATIEENDFESFVCVYSKSDLHKTVVQRSQNSREHRCKDTDVRVCSKTSNSGANLSWPSAHEPCFLRPPSCSMAELYAKVNCLSDVEDE